MKKKKKKDDEKTGGKSRKKESVSVVDTFFRDHTTGTKFKIVRLVNLFWNFPSEIEVRHDPIFLGSGSTY